jgi:phosphatidylserine/phosphatidylglycerophosphate/cardiolipin synthase-like enzyme
MTWKTRILVCLTALLVAFGGGAGVGYHYAKSNPQVETYFTPYDDGIGQYLAHLDKARSTVHIAAYTFTDSRITDKLVELVRDRKVKVYALLDQSQTRGWSAESERKVIEGLRAVGAEVIIGTSEKHHEIMHDKFTVIDGHLVEDGSWNYTKAANFQANVLNFIDDRDRAQRFLVAWQKMATFMRTQDQSLKLDDKADDATPADDDAPKKPRRRR